jgi:cytochrome c553
MRYRLAFALMLGLAVSGQLQATQEGLTRSASEAAVCSGCHAVTSGTSVPSLRGLSAQAIEQQMQALKRSGGQSAMHRLINAYDDAQIRGIANVLAPDVLAKDVFVQGEPAL